MDEAKSKLAAGSSSAAAFSVRAASIRALQELLLSLDRGDASSSSSALTQAGGASSSSSSGSSTSPWRLLILDQFARDAISPLVRVGHLRKWGVTLHLALDSPRQGVPDVPAVYIARGTQANVDRILQDLQDALYDRCSLNFVPSLPSPLLEKLAEGAVASESVHAIGRVADQPSAFVALEDDLFELRLKNTYATLNSPALSEQEAEDAILGVAQGLLSVVSTLGVVPVIRCPSGGVTQAVAEKLSELLTAQLEAELENVPGGAAADNMFLGADVLSSAGSAAGLTALQHSADRPLLLITERNACGVGVLLRHAWTYQALAHDLLGLDLNKVTLEGGDAKKADEGGEQKDSLCDLDSASDAFWSRHAMKAFPEIAVGVKAAIAEYQRSLDEFQRLSQGTGLSSSDVAALAAGQAPSEGSVTNSAAQGSASKAANLHAFVASVPALQSQKRAIDMHTNVATAVLGHIKKRGIDALVALEEPASTGEKLLSASAILPVLQDNSGDMTEGAQASFRDKLRLFALLMLQVSENDGSVASQTEMDACEMAIKRTLVAEGGDAAELERVLKFVQHLRGLLRMQKQYTENRRNNQRGQAQANGGGGSESMSSFASKFGVNMGAVLGGQNDLTSNTKSQLTQLFSAGVKAFMPSKNSKLPLTALMERMMANSAGSNDGSGATGVGENPVDTFCYLDPLHNARVKSSGSGDNALRRRTTGYRRAIAFVVGGGNYVEYQNLRAQTCGEDSPLSAGDDDATGAAGLTQSGAEVGRSTSRVIYGSTDLPTGEQFLQQLAALGAKLG